MAKRKFFYDTMEDSSRRIASSVVMARKSPKDEYYPCWIQQVSGLNTDQQAHVIFLPVRGDGDKVTALPLMPEYFEVRNLPQLGYVDYGEHSFYLSRRPIRNGKAGINRQNLAIPQPGNGVRIPNFENFLPRKEFYNVFVNKYDTMKHVFDKIMSAEEPLKRAFSKTMALSIDDMESVSLWNRGYRVGVCNNPKKYGPVFKLPNKFKYLQEELAENGIKIE